VGARGCCEPWSRRRPRRFAPAAFGDCGVDWGCLHNSRYYVAEF